MNVKIVRQVVSVVLALTDQNQLFLCQFCDITFYGLGTASEISDNHLDGGVALDLVANKPLGQRESASHTDLNINNNSDGFYATGWYIPCDVL